jgi:ABC-type branched-subunit amino acid transport system ATPase component
MIALSGVTVRLGGARPLSDLTVTLDGDVHGVIGPNGAGKTTLLNLVSGFADLTAGDVRAFDRDLSTMSPRRRALWGVRRTFQTECLAGELTGRGNVAVMADGAVPRRERRAAVQQALEVTGLAEPDLPTGAMNAYQRKLVEIARALVGAPRVLLLDEPGGGIAPQETEALKTVIRRIPEAYGAMVVLVDHDVDLVAATCPRVTVLDFGELLATGPTAEVLEDDRVRAAWLGTADVA